MDPPIRSLQRREHVGLRHATSDASDISEGSCVGDFRTRATRRRGDVSAAKGRSQSFVRAGHARAATIGKSAAERANVEDARVDLAVRAQNRATVGQGAAKSRRRDKRRPVDSEIRRRSTWRD